MKARYNGILAILMLIYLLGLSACTKDLNQIPKATATNSAVFGSEQGLQLYANSFYSIIPSAGTVIRGDNMSDYAAITTIPDFLRQGVYSSLMSTGWDWGNLRNVNYFIANCNNLAVPLTVRENYIGIARFFRAWWYFSMVEKFGDVPWYSTPIPPNDSAELFKARDPRTLVMDSILADINYACQYITMTKDPTCSQITKWVAYAFKSRVCLFAGTFRKYHPEYNLQGTADQWLQEAADAAKAVMDSSGFTLNQSGGVSPTGAYRQLFISTQPPSDEVMLADIVAPSLGVFDDCNWYYTSATYGDRLSFDRTFIDTYLKLDGTPFTNTPGWDTMTFINEMQDRDGRLQQTIRTPGYTRTNAGQVVPAPPTFSYTYTGYMPIKFTLDDESLDQGNISTNSIPVIRYAEILLNYAEAKAELGTLTNQDWAETIGALRARAGLTGGLTQIPTEVDTFLQHHYFPNISNPAILEIRRCRSIELALEGFRFYDLVRWDCGNLLTQPWTGMYVPALNVPMDLNGDGIPDVCFIEGNQPSNPISGVQYIDVEPTINGRENPMQLTNGTYGEITWLKDGGRVWNDKMYLYPIPESALIKNAKLGQNSGWQ